MEWLCEYEKYNGGDVYLGDDSPTIIIGHGRVKIKLKDGRIGSCMEMQKRKVEMRLKNKEKSNGEPLCKQC